MFINKTLKLSEYKICTDNMSYWSKQMYQISELRVCLSDLDVLQPVGRVGGAGQGEVVFGSHPGFQAFQLSGGSVSGHVTH